MPLPKGVLAYGLLGLLLGAMLARGRRARGKIGGAVKLGALGAGVALLAPKVGVQLPGLPPPAVRRA